VSKITTLASGQLNGADTILMKLVEADETPAVVIVTWPAKPTVLHPRRFPDVAAMVARLSPPPQLSWPQSSPGDGIEHPARHDRLALTQDGTPVAAHRNLLRRPRGVFVSSLGLPTRYSTEQVPRYDVEDLRYCPTAEPRKPHQTPSETKGCNP
jgi:hypothetical protein